MKYFRVFYFIPQYIGSQLRIPDMSICKESLRMLQIQN